MTIQMMSDVETPFKAKLKSQFFSRQLNYTDEEFYELIKPYMGNPFL